MNAPKPHPAVAKIQAKIKEFHELEADFKNDKTLVLAQSALETAKADAAVAEAEDDSIDPEQLVDLRLEARRQVEIAEIRLTRAQKAVESRGIVVRTPLLEAGDIAAEALLGIEPHFCQRLESELRKLIGDGFYEATPGIYQNLIYKKQAILHGHARQMESSVSIFGLNEAITLLEDANRLG